MITKFKIFEGLESIFLDIYVGGINKLKQYIKNGGDINVVEKITMRNMLSYVLWRYNEMNLSETFFNMFKLLIDSNVDINTIDYFERTILIDAADYHNMNIIHLLIESDVIWNMVESHGWDFMDFLSDGEKKEIIKQYPEKYQKFIKDKKSKEFNL